MLNNTFNYHIVVNICISYGFSMLIRYFVNIIKIWIFIAFALLYRHEFELSFYDRFNICHVLFRAHSSPALRKLTFWKWLSSTCAICRGSTCPLKWPLTQVLLQNTVRGSTSVQTRCSITSSLPMASKKKLSHRLPITLGNVCQLWPLLPHPSPNISRRHSTIRNRRLTQHVLRAYLLSTAKPDVYSRFWFRSQSRLTWWRHPQTSRRHPPVFFSCRSHILHLLLQLCTCRITSCQHLVTAAPIASVCRRTLMTIKISLISECTHTTATLNTCSRRRALYRRPIPFILSRVCQQVPGCMNLSAPFTVTPPHSVPSRRKRCGVPGNHGNDYFRGNNSYFLELMTFSNCQEMTFASAYCGSFAALVIFLIHLFLCCV